jgi:DNA-binding MarR family transcriptional regulator
MILPPLDLTGYFPFYLGTLSNRWTTASSKTYLEKFGIGIADWRVLASVQAQGVANAQMIVNLIYMDAGAVSRSLTKLAAEGHVEPVPGKFAGRTKPFQLTSQGHELYAKLLKIALEREARLLAQLTEEERVQLLSMMRKILDQVEQI